MLSEAEKEAIAKLETEEEKRERESAGLYKPKRGRPPGVPNKPKMADETLEAGCVSFVKFCWLLSRGGAYVVGGQLDTLTETEIKEGAAEAKNLVNRFAFLVTVLMIIGFPVWLFGKVIVHFERRKVSASMPRTLEVVAAETGEKHGND